ncbi:hypothetical protein ACFQY7_12460 [Actinomadura luteofluorescens]|uniref:hypothetical protein n=1 Tax=Actinomadura luteofluorescens TaxID=46163 RepID=UPI00363AD4F1
MPSRIAAAALTAAGTLALAGAAAFSAGSAQAAPARPEAPPAQRAAVDFTGIVALSNCSGSLVRGPRSRDTDAALVLTNGHCLESGMPEAGEVIVDQRSSRTFTLLDRTGAATSAPSRPPGSSTPR